MKPFAFICVFWMCLALIPVGSMAARVEIIAFEDAYVDRNYPDTNYGSSTQLIVEYFEFLGTVEEQKYAYIKFDLEEMIPPGATVNAAFLEIYQNDPCQGNIFGIYPLTESWLEDDVTWNNRPSYTSRIEDIDGPGPCGWYQVEVTSVVQDWHSGSIPNYGIGIMFTTGLGTTGSYPREFSSREDVSFEPRLVIIFNAESIVLGPEMDSMVSEVDPGLNYGTDSELWVTRITTPGNRRWSYLQFEVDTIPAGAVIDYARLRLNRRPETLHTFLREGLYDVTEPWDEMTITWNNKPVDGGSAWSVGNEASGLNAWVNWDATSLLSGWLTGSSNYGLVIKGSVDPQSEGNLGRFRSREHTNEELRPQMEVFYTPGPANEFVLWQEFEGLAYGDASWGDFDGDGDLDLVVCGETDDDTLTITYENDNGTLVEYPNNLPGVVNAVNNCLAWGDYDNDGDLDLAIAGLADSGNVTCIYNNDGDGNLTWDAYQNRPDSGLVQVRNAALAWGDYDGDGDLDLVVQGDDTVGIRIDLYINGVTNEPPGILRRTPPPLTPLRTGTLDWVDYDGDGDMDLIQTGYDGIARDFACYENKPRGNLVFDGNHGVAGVNVSDVAWGDFDNDGDMDLAYSGSRNSSYYAGVYQNDGAGNLTEVDSLMDLSRSAVAWGDYDNDGMLDLVLCGRDAGGSVHTNLFRYNGVDAFVQCPDSFPGLHSGSASWADVDEDGDLDLLLTGRDKTGTVYDRYFRLYRNVGGSANTAPKPPNSFSAFQSCPMGPPFPGTLHLQWGGASDTETPDNALYYCVRVGTGMNEDDIFSGIFGSPLMGNVGQTTRLDIAIPHWDHYYWSVRAIDAGLMASEWSHGWCSWDTDNVRSKKIDNLEDAYVDSQNPNTKHGVTDETRLIVGDNSGAWGTIARSYLKCYLGGELPPDTNAVIKAELFLYCIDSQPPGTYLVGVWEEGVDEWEEDEITWYNAPIMFDPYPARVVSINGSGWYSWDITNIFLSSGDNLTLVLRGKDPKEGTTGVVAEFWSREYSANPALRPYISVTFSTVSGVEDGEGTPPNHFSLGQNYPNPFNPHTSIGYTIPDEAANEDVVLKIYDVAGRLVKTLIEAPQPAGVYQVMWNGTNDKGNNVASGVYFYRLQWNGRSQTKKMVLLR